MRPFTAAFCIVTSVIAIAGCAQTTTRDRVSTEANEHLKLLLEKGVAKGYPGMAMLIENSDGGIHSAAAGYSDLEAHQPMDVDIGFHIGSVNKTFTSVATLHLVDQGKLVLSASLKSILGAAVGRIPNAERITVAQLLDHSSGIYATNNDMSYLTTMLGPKADPHRIWSFSELIALADKDRQKPADEPGSGHYYADTNYVLLGMIIEKVSGVSYKGYIKRTILEPLRMKHTYFYSDFLEGRVRPPMKQTQGYLVATKDIRDVIDINPMFKPVPDEKRGGNDVLNTTLASERVDSVGGIITTLGDLAKFADVLFRGKLLSNTSQGILTAALDGAEKLALDKHRTWTLQAMHRSWGVLLYKEGDGPGGVTALMAYFPAKDQIFIGFSNSFGFFDEVDFMMDDVIGPWVSAAMP